MHLAAARPADQTKPVDPRSNLRTTGDEPERRTATMLGSFRAAR